MADVMQWRWAMAILTAMWLTGAALAQDQDFPALSPQEFQSVRERLIDQYARIESVAVTFEKIEMGPQGPQSQSTWELARSGDKLYRKRWWPAEPGEPPSERWGIAVWDGKHLKAYDSKLDNGSIRGEYKPNSRAPDPNADYGWMLGDRNHGDIGQLLRRFPEERWTAAWIAEGKTLQLSIAATQTNPTPWTRYTWTLDMTRGGVVQAFSIVTRFKEDGPFEPFVQWTVRDMKEVAPGLFLPAKVDGEMNIPDPEAPQPRLERKQMVLKDARVNVPEIESLFTFEFPNGSMYYDYINKKSVVAGVSRAEVEHILDEQVDQIAAVAPQAMESEAAADADDWAVADQLLEPSVASADGSRPWLILGILMLAFGVIVAFWRTWRRPAKESAL